MMTKERIAELRLELARHSGNVPGGSGFLLNEIESLQARVQELERNREHMANVIREQAEVNIERGQRIQDLEKDKARLDMFNSPCWRLAKFSDGWNVWDVVNRTYIRPTLREAIDAAMKGTNEKDSTQ